MSTAFAPGRVNLIGEHTDYNGGLALPFAVSAGVTVTAAHEATVPIEPLLSAALDAMGAIDVGLTVTSDLPAGAGLSSSAAVCVAACLALGADASDPLALAQRCQAIEQRALGTETGLLDQLAILCGQPGEATLIDFGSQRMRQIPLELGAFRLVVADSGERRRLARSGYGQRRAECREAADLLGVRSLSDAPSSGALPAPLGRRVRHVLTENSRVLAAVEALEQGDIAALGPLLDASHASLRDDYEVSTPAVETTVAALKRAGALGARIMGGGFGGAVLGLMPADVALPDGAVAVAPGAGARLLPARVTPPRE